jgi:molybdate transport system regulatory protein
MRTSVRNQFLATVRSVQKGAVNAEVILTIKGGDALVSQITMGSLESLGLREGAEAWALIKASWIALAVGERPRISARNLWEGVVESVKPGAVNSEIALALPGGEMVTAVVTEESVRRMKLREGVRAWAVFKANSVILAVN